MGAARQEIKRNRSVCIENGLRGCKVRAPVDARKVHRRVGFERIGQYRIEESFTQETRPKRIWWVIKNRSLRIVHLFGFNRSQQSVGLYAFIACRNVQKETNTISIAYLSE